MSPGAISQAAADLRSGATTSVELTLTSLQGIEDLDGHIESFVLTDSEGALKAAEEADQLLAAGRDLGPLTGIPIGMKDIVHMEGLPTQCGSPAYKEQPQPHDADIVTRLREAGAVIVGKTTVHELACGVYSPPASNPWDTNRIPGGSSGGSGAAVAAGLVAMAVGSDTGGSIRIPASVCGVAGLKPTHGLVSTNGVEPLSWSLDHMGPLAETVEDCAVSLGAMTGQFIYTDSLEQGVTGMKLGVLIDEPFSPMETDTASAVHTAVEHLRSLGAKPEMVQIPELAFTLPAEFGLFGPEAATYHRQLLQQRPDLIDPTIRRVLTCASLMPTGHYLKARQARLLISDAIRRCFTEGGFSALISPTLPATAAGLEQQEFLFENRTEAVAASYVRTTAPFNLSGLPALSIPCGFDRKGLPIGLQIAGRPFDERSVLQIGAAYEATTPWLEQKPPVHITRQ